MDGNVKDRTAADTLPWRLFDENGVICILGADGSHKRPIIHWAGFDNYGAYPLDERRAFAAYIVKAANGWPKLVACLNTELVWHEAADKALSKQPPGGDREWRRMEHQDRITEIRAILSDLGEG